MEFLDRFLENLVAVSLEAAPWLLFGLLSAGLIKVWIPESFMKRVLGDGGGWPVIKAALIGAPLPLCSCGVLPAAIGLRRAGASRGATLSFLIATPETGVDSIGISYVLLGPFLTIMRVIAAISTAIVTGLLAVVVLDRARLTNVTVAFNNATVHDQALTLATAVEEKSGGCCSTATSTAASTAANTAASSAASTKAVVTEPTNSCNDDCGASDNLVSTSQTFWQRNVNGLRYAMSDIWDDIAVWLLLGLVLAGLMATFIPDHALAQWGSGLPAMLLMLLVGIPMYICATAATPLAAGLLLAGISPGTLLVLLLAGPATNLATIAILLKEMGRVIVAVYLCGIAVSSITFGLLTDYIVFSNGIDINAQIHDATELLPQWLAILSVVLLVAAAIKPLRRRVIGC